VRRWRRSVTGEVFSKGGGFAAWLGLAPRQISTGDHTLLGKISKAKKRYGASLLNALMRVGQAALAARKWHRGLIDAENLGDETVTAAALTARTGQPEPPRQEDAGVPRARHPDTHGSYGPAGGRWRAQAARNDSDGVHGSEAGMARRSPIAQNH